MDPPTMPNSSADVFVGGGGEEIVLFGVRVVVADPMRKCVSLNNLSEYEQPHEDHPVEGNLPASCETNKAAGSGYGSSDEVVPRCNSHRTRERKRGVPWTEDEHKLFLLGLQKVGKGDWRGISKNFVKTRTPTQVASHAQKYFLRRTNLSRRRRRSSLFDITADSVAAMEEEQSPNLDKPASLSEMVPLPTTTTAAAAIPPVILTVPLTKSFPSPNLKPAMESVNVVAPTTVIRPIPIVPLPGISASPLFDLNLSLDSPSSSLESSRRPSSAFHTMPNSFSNGDGNSSIISVS
ncbi:hypothetical protein MLD38_031966 [Melastoma candidum]|uniref:Uncharacterized protein n=1 Tax=Melastoma candidum TaxID=119954 RepID=A0ACB9MRB5_9MYRT|nr:hypothetical protein MLD38_031966 [Melastoma candidum]